MFINDKFSDGKPANGNKRKWKIQKLVQIIYWQ